MGWLGKTLFRLQPLFRSKEIEAELTEEIRSHLQMQIEANLAAGMPAEDARFAAHRQFGGVDQVKERFRDERGLPWIEDFLRDLNLALRQLRKSPGFATTAIVTIAVGIGGCAAIFSVVNAVLLRPLDYAQPDRILRIAETQPPRFSSIPATPGDYLDWKAQASAFDQLAAAYNDSRVLMVDGNATQLRIRCVTANFFVAFGVQPLIGRGFSPEDEVPGQDRVAILSYPFWQSAFAGRGDVINKTIRLDDRPYIIVGVLPPVGDLEYRSSLFTPIAFAAADRTDYYSHYLYVSGRLKRGASLDQAASEMAVVNDRIARQHPQSNKGRGVRVTTLVEATVGDVRPQLLILLGAVGFLLLIACANVASLLLARASSRQKEIALRAALGASRGRIVRQFLCESLLLGVAGGLLGIMIAFASMGPLRQFANHSTPRSSYIALDGHVLVFTCGLLVLASLTFGLIPALQATHGDMAGTLKESGRGSTGGRARQRVRASLVAIEIALALMLLAGTGVLARTLTAMQNTDEGFKFADVYTEGIWVNHGNATLEPAKLLALVSASLDRISALPEVRDAAFSTGLPMGGIRGAAFALPRLSQLAPSELPQTDAYAITPSYFELLSIPLIRGREFSPQDAAGSPPVVIVNRELAEKYFPGMDPIGQRIMIEDLNSAVWRQIVGVVGDVRPRGPESMVGPQTYEPLAQNPSTYLELLVRTKAFAPAPVSAIRGIFHSLDPYVPFETLYPYATTVVYAWVRQRFSIVLLGLFSGAALLLAAIGIYGVMAYSVSQRTNEIGIRMALGAQARDVLQLILGSGARIVGLGVLIGLAGSLAFTRLLSSLLFNTSPNDPLSLIAVALTLSAVAFLACWIPARRATKVDPVVALRSE